MIIQDPSYHRFADHDASRGGHAGAAADTARSNESASPVIRIRLLGGFRIERNGIAVAYGRKSPRKPLTLLKVLAAEGGRAVDAVSLAAILWPELDGDAAACAFGVTLYRLRRLIGVPGALYLSDRKLSLDSGFCVLDTWQFEALVAAIENLPADAETSSVQPCMSHAHMLLRAYPGHFLADEPQDAWAIALRNRLREKFRRTVVALGVRLERSQQWHFAAHLYARAIEIDDLAEPFYRRLMTCYRELGEMAEALHVYRRCCELLSVVYGLKPSVETEAIRASCRERDSR